MSKDKGVKNVKKAKADKSIAKPMSDYKSENKGGIKLPIIKAFESKAADPKTTVKK